MKKMIQAVCAATLLLGSSSVEAADSAYSYVPIALSGQTAPGAGGRTYTKFTGRPLINNSGHLAFAAELSGDPDSNVGIWSGPRGAMESIVQSGQTAPDAPNGESFPDYLGLSGFSDTGELLFSSNLAPEDSASGYSIWLGRAASVEPVAVHGSPAHGLPDGVTINTRLSRSALISRTGIVSVRAGLSGPDVDAYNDGVLWVGRPGAMEVLAREGDQAAGMPDGVVYRHFGTTTVLVNMSEQVAFNAHVFDGADPAWTAIWAGERGATRIIVEEGTEAPGMPDGVTYGQPNSPQLNNAGMVAFMTKFEGSPALFGAYAGHPDDLQLLWYYGQQADGLPAGVHFAGGTGAVIDGDGQVAVSLKLDGPGVSSSSEYALWKGLPGDLQLIAREGDQAPGAPDGTVFTGSHFGYQLNGLGRLLFSGRVTGSRQGLWCTDGSGAPELIVLEGALLEVMPGDWREVDRILATPPRGGGQGGAPLMINEGGRIIFRAEFTDGTSGVFMAIPEPTTLSLLALGGLAILRRKRRACR